MPVGGEPVEVRRLDLRVAEAAEVAVAEVVGQEDDDVGLRGVGEGHEGKEEEGEDGEAHGDTGGGGQTRAIATKRHEKTQKGRPEALVSSFLCHFVPLRGYPVCLTRP